MLLSTQTEYLSRNFGHEKAIEIIADAGFDAIDLTLFEMKENENSPFLYNDYLDFAYSLKELAKGRGLTFNQAHAPFPSSKEDKFYNELIFDRITRAISIAGTIGAKCIVVHPMQHLYYLDNSEKLKEMNMDFYKSLSPYAKAAGVKIALENMWKRTPDKKQITVSACSRTKDFCNLLDSLNDECFVACLDLGHCGLYGFDAAEMIKGLGKERLQALHVHDNDYQSDRHTAPYLAKMHWDTICEALAKIGYKGDLTLEADLFFEPFPKEIAPDVSKFLHAIGRNLIKEIEKARP